MAYIPLKSNSQNIISVANKWPYFVITNKKDEIMKVKTILDDKTKYVKLGATDTGDPAVKIERAS